MAEVSKNAEKIQEPSFKLNYATVILLLVIIIPLGYTIWVNLQDVMQSPTLTKRDLAPNQTTATQTQATTPGGSGTDRLVLALKATVDKPGFQTFIDLGLAYYAVDSTEAAIRAWQKAIPYNPKSAITYNNIAAAYGKLDRWDDEIAVCKQALAIDSSLALAKNNMAWALSKKAGK